MLNKIVDLHIHSFYSDGTMSPKDILDAALAKGVGLLAVADHNILDGSLELQKLCHEYDVQYLPAVELDSLDNRTNIHILGYGMNLQDEEFKAFVKRNRILLDTVSIKLIEKMQEHIDSVTLSDYLAFTYDNKKGGWKALHYFKGKGLTKSLLEGMAFYSKYGCSYDCVDFPSVRTVCKCIHKAGGKAVLAHPGIVIKETDVIAFQKEVLRLVDMGLDGIECYYPSHTDDITKVCLAICKERNLLITAGSDCHGEFGDTEVGEMNITVKQLNLEDLC